MNLEDREWVVEWYSPIGWSLSYNAVYEMNGHVATAAEINNWACKLEEAMVVAKRLQDDGDGENDGYILLPLCGPSPNRVSPMQYRVRNKRTNDILPAAIL